MAAMPILSRLYPPEEFGVFALYIATASLVAVVATARYELAVMLPKEDEDAASLVVLSLGIAAVLSLLSLLIVCFFNQQITGFLGSAAVGKWLYFIPLTVLFTGIFQALNYWSNRKKQFRRLAWTRMAQGTGTAGGQVALGVRPVPGGLVVGAIVGQALAAAVFFRLVWKEDKKIFLDVDASTVVRNAKVYKKFPIYSTFGALLDNAALQIPIFMLNRFFSAHITGIFSLTFRALNLPMSLISAALSQVLFQRIVGIHLESPEKLRAYILKIFFGLLALMLPFIILMWFLGEPIFAMVFGESWRQAGQFAALLSIAVAVRFAVSPLSTVLAMDHNVKRGVLWQFIYFVTITTTLFLARELAIYEFFIVFVIHEVLLYGLYFYFIIEGTSNFKERLTT